MISKVVASEIELDATALNEVTEFWNSINKVSIL
jgi:hypothetical protein